MKIIVLIVPQIKLIITRNQGFALTLVFRVRVFGTRKWPIAIAICQRACRELEIVVQGMENYFLS